MSGILSAQVSGKVESVINLGSIDYAYLLLSEQGYYKTAAYPTGLLSIGENIEILPGGIPNTNFRSFIKTTNGNIGVFAAKVETESFSMPISEYGVPLFHDDILWFQSKIHFDEFYTILTDFSDAPYESREDLLMVFERQFPNFSSFNALIKETFDFENGFSDDELVALTNFDYFKDDVVKSLINKYGEIGIGDKVHTMFMSADDTKCITLITSELDLNILRNFREKEKDEDVLLRYPIIKGEVVCDGIPIPYITKDLYSVDITGGILADLSYTSHLQIDNVSCSTTKVKVKYILNRTTDNDAHLVIDPTLFEGILTINWGDGTSTTQAMPPIPVTLDPSGTATWHQTELFLTHEYATEGFYSISSSGVFTSEWIANPTQFTMSDSKEWNSPAIACTNGSWSGKLDDPIFSADHKAICEGWIKNWEALNNVGAKTTNYKKVSGNWKKRQENISAEINAVFRDSDCLYKESKQKYDYGHEKDIQAVKLKWWKNRSVANGDCYGTYTIEHEGISYTYTLIYNPCQ